MRPLIVLAATGAVALGLQAAAASPFTTGAGAPEAGSLVTSVHHKPGHKGGPPWTRDRYDVRERERVGTRSTCRTTTQTQYDPYRGGMVQRQVQVCDTY